MVRMMTWKVKALQPLKPDINPKSLHSSSYSAMGQIQASAASASLRAARAGVPCAEIMSGDPRALQSLKEGKRTPSSCTALGGEVRRLAAVPRAQGRPPMQSLRLLGKLKHLQSATVGFLSPHSDIYSGAIHSELLRSQCVEEKTFWIQFTSLHIPYFFCMSSHQS